MAPQDDRQWRSIFTVGDVLNNTYRIEAILGRGGTSEVYRARTEVSGHLVALKALRFEYSDNEAFLTLMRREEEIREIQHDAIVRYFHNQRTASGQIFLVMEFVDGPGLDRKMKAGGLGAADLLVLAERVAGGLQAAHAKNIVHRDLSPDNIILRNGDPAKAVIIDFGIAKDSSPGAMTVIGTDFAGKFAFAAPEQLAGSADQRSDVYALGAVLLAAYRGTSPKLGADLLQIARAKADPLDTTGVPEPLKSLIDRMTDPDRDKRLQNAGEVLEFIRNPADREQADDVTVFAALAPPKARERALDAPRRRSGLWPTIGLAAAVVLAVAAGWVFGPLRSLFGPDLVVADPYTLVVERPAGAPPDADGHVPSEEIRTELAQRVSAAGGAADLTLARGDIEPSWGEDVLSLVDAVAGLDEWRVAVTGNAAEITGLTENRAVRDQLVALFAGGAMPVGLQSTLQIELGPRLLAPGVLSPILAAHEDCGELRLIDPPADGYPQEAGIAVEGRVARAETRGSLAAAIGRVAGDRAVSIRTEVLNPTLCLLDGALPSAPPGGFEIVLSDGVTGLPNPEGRFAVGDNPVIDVTIPQDLKSGYLYVSALDVSGNIFHLLPNQFSPDNTIGALREGQDGPVTVRLAFPIAEAEAAAATGSRKLAFLVDETALGDTRLLVLYAAEPLFANARPGTESAASYLEALQTIGVPVASLDSRILTTVARE